MYEQRSKQIRKHLHASKIDALLLTHLPMVRWACGYTGSNGLLYVDANQSIFVTDVRYTTQAAMEVKNAEIFIGSQGKLLPSLVDKVGNKIHRIGFDADSLTVNDHAEMQKQWPNHDLITLHGLLQDEIAVKTPEEINLIAHAQQITDQVFNELLTIIKPGMTEKDLAAEIVYRQLKHGADQIPEHFWPLVASGPNSAIVHAHATNRKLENGDVVLVDFGCVVGGYTSDMTRTIVLGKASQKVQEVYELVLKSQTAALTAAKAGITGADLDAVARDIIKAGGYDISHNLGHSLGLEIHQAPSATPRNTKPLPEGAVITIEPGVYIPGKFGVRIEDIIVLEKGGNRNLTTSPKELIIL